MTYRRTISPAERVHLTGRKLAPPFAGQFVVQGVGTIDPARLRQAVMTASERCPGSRLIKVGNEWVDSGRTPRVRVVSGDDLDMRDLTANPVYDSPLGESLESTSEVILVTGPELDTLVFRIFHGVMDMSGLKAWMTDIFAALRGENAIGTLDTVTDRELWENLGAPDQRAQPSFKYRSIIRGRKPRRGEPRQIVRGATVYGKVQGVTAKIAAVLAAQLPENSRFMIPVDLRRHDASIRATGNLTSYVWLDAEPNQSWSRLNKRLLMQLMKNHDLDEMRTIVLLGGLPSVIRLGVYRVTNAISTVFGRELANAVISHTGKIELNSLSAPDFQPRHAWVMPISNDFISIFFAVTELDDRLELTVSCRNRRDASPQLDHIVAQIVKALGAGNS